MTQATLTQLLEALKTLPQEDLRTVERVVRDLLSPSQREAEREAALRVMEEAGLVKEVKHPSVTPLSDTMGYSPQEWRAMQSLVEAGLLKEIKPRHSASTIVYSPVPISGKPLSETIIEERR